MWNLIAAILCLLVARCSKVEPMAIKLLSYRDRHYTNHSLTWSKVLSLIEVQTLIIQIS